MDNNNTGRQKPDGADAILKRQHLIDGDHLPALVERFVVGVFVFTLNFLYTFVISIFRPVKLSKHFLQQNNDKLVLSSPVTYITVAVFITQVLMSELSRFDSNNKIKDVVIGSTNQFFTDVLFQFLPKIVILFVLIVMLAKLGEKLCNQPKANLFRLMCYLYGSVLIFVRVVNQTISTYELNFRLFGFKVDSTVYRNVLESIQHPIDFGLSEYDDFYIHLGYLEVYVFLYLFVAIAIGNGKIVSIVKKVGSWLRFVMYWALIIVCYVSVNAIGYTYSAITNESQSTVYCKGANFIEVADGFMINTVITNSGTSTLYLTGEAIGSMEMFNKPEGGVLISRIELERIKQDGVMNQTDLFDRAELKKLLSSDGTFEKYERDLVGKKVIDMIINQGNVTEIPPKSTKGITLHYIGKDYADYQYVDSLLFTEILNSSDVGCFTDSKVVVINKR